MLALQNAVILDGMGGCLKGNTTVLVEGNRIVQVSRDIPMPNAARGLDLNGCFLLPGLIDVHTHMGSSAQLERPSIAGTFTTYGYAENRLAGLRWGVTTVRSCGDYMPDIIQFRDAVNQGKICAPRVLAAGKVFQAKDGHPGHTVYFSDQNILENVCLEVEEDTDIEAQVTELVNQGVDWIKAFISDDNKMKFGQSVPRLSLAQLRRITDAAHDLGRPVMMHVDDFDDMRDAILAGADTIEHTINAGATTVSMPDEVLEMLVAHGVWVVPTIVATKYFDGRITGAPLVMPSLMDAMRQMIKAGVKLGVGCDSGIPFVPYGKCVHEELQLLCQAGMGPMDALTAATGGNAKLLGKDREFGSIRPGLAADLLVLGSNPLMDISSTQDIKMVFREGKLVEDRFMTH